MKGFVKKITSFPRYILVFGIKVYQLTLSPDHSYLVKSLYPYGFCRFYPSCSEYSKIAIIKHGVVKGGYQSVWRLIRCNPWVEPAIDKNK